MSNMEHPVAKGPAVCLAAAAKRTNAPETREQVGSAQRYGWSKKPLLGRSEASPWPTRARVDIRKTKFVTQQDPPCVAAGAARCRQTKSALIQHRQIKPAAHSVSSAFGIGNIKGSTRTKDSAVLSRPRGRGKASSRPARTAPKESPRTPHAATPIQPRPSLTPSTNVHHRASKPHRNCPRIPVNPKSASRRSYPATGLPALLKRSARHLATHHPDCRRPSWPAGQAGTSVSVPHPPAFLP